MNIDFLHTFLKFLGINLGICYSYHKIIHNLQPNNIKKFLLIIISITFSFILSVIQNETTTIPRLIFIYISYSLLLGNFTKYNLGYSLIITTFSISISYIATYASAFITFLIVTFFNFINYKSFIVSITILILEITLIFLFFRIRRLKNGFPFIRKNNENEYINIFIIVINLIIIFLYFLLENFRALTFHHLTMGFILFSALLIPIIQKTFILYQKQKLQTKTLKEYEVELQEIKQKLNTALEEKHILVKTNHEFYHRQEALKQKLNTLISNKHNFTSETAEEYSTILDRINNLSNEYTTKLKQHPLLPKTNIEEIDDMFTYMQSECEKNNIEFALKITADIKIIIEKFIPKNKFETLIGDLIRNAIIAINHNENDFKSILVIMGIKDNFFELCVHDSGINFEIDTLLHLGEKPITTHKDEGGTGIGFVTTFETLEYCNASLIINEFKPKSNNYTKSIVIKFDNKYQYIINTYRSDNFSNKKTNYNKNICITNNEMI